MGRCSGDSLFGCNVTTDKQNYVCDQCHGRKIPLSRCRFSEHYMFQGEDGHYICKKPKLQVKKFPFVYGWYHLIVFQNAKFAKKGTEVVNSKRPARFGLLTPEQVLPRGLWEDGIPLTLRKQLHRLIPIGISRDSEMYVDRITMSDDAMDQSTPRAGAQLPNFGRRSDGQRRRRPNHFPYNVKMEDLNSNPIITTNQIPPFESPFSNTSLQPLQTPILTKGPSTTNQQRIKQEPMITSDFVTSPSASFPDLQVFMHSTDSTHTFSFSPLNKRKVTSSASSSSSQNTSFPSLSMTPQGGGGGGGSMLPPLHPSLNAIKEEAPGNTDGFFSPASLAAFAMDSSSQAITTTEFCTPLSKRRKCEVVELSTDTSGLHDFSMKNVVVTPHANI